MDICVLSTFKHYPSKPTHDHLFAMCPYLVRDSNEGNKLGLCMRNDDAPAPCISQLLKLNYNIARDNLTLVCPYTHLSETVSLSEYVDEEETWL